MGILFGFAFGSLKANGCTDEVIKVLKEMMIDDCEAFVKSKFKNKLKEVAKSKKN